MTDPINLAEWSRDDFTLRHKIAWRDDGRGKNVRVHLWDECPFCAAIIAVRTAHYIWQFCRSGYDSLAWTEMEKALARFDFGDGTDG